MILRAVPVFVIEAAFEKWGCAIILVWALLLLSNCLWWREFVATGSGHSSLTG